MLEVDSAPTSALVTTAEARAVCGVSGTADDAWIDALIARASAAVEAFIGQPVRSGQYTETLLMDGRAHTAWLSRWPVTAVSALDVDGADALASYTVKHQPGGGLTRWDERRSVPWPAGELVVSYTAGAATTPPDVAAAVLETVRAWFPLRGADPTIKSATYSDGTSVAYAVALPGLPAAALDVLAPHRVPRVA